MTVLADTQLRAPSRPKVDDDKTERSLRELETKVRELQDILRSYIAGHP